MWEPQRAKVGLHQFSVERTFNFTDLTSRVDDILVEKEAPNAPEDHQVLSSPDTHSEVLQCQRWTWHVQNLSLLKPWNSSVQN